MRMSATVEMLRAGDRVLVHGPDGTLDAVIVQVADYASSVVVDMLLNGQPARRSVPAGLVRAVEIGSEGQRWPRITEQNAAQFEPPKLRPFNTAEKRLRGWPPWRWFWQMTGSDWQRDSSSYESQVRRWKHLVDREHKSWALSLSSSDEHAALLERWCACGDERIFRAAVRRTPADVELRVVLKKEASRAVVDGLVEHGVLPGEWRSFAFDTAEWRAFCDVQPHRCWRAYEEQLSAASLLAYEERAAELRGMPKAPDVHFDNSAMARIKRMEEMGIDNEPIRLGASSTVIPMRDWLPERLRSLDDVVLREAADGRQAALLEWATSCITSNGIDVTALGGLGLPPLSAVAMDGVAGAEDDEDEDEDDSDDLEGGECEACDET